MPIRISDKHDAMILAMLSNISSANADTLLQNVKTQLDANYAQFKDGSGNYTRNHVKAAFLQVTNRGK
jgi:hypothetical protein